MSAADTASADGVSASSPVADGMPRRRALLAALLMAGTAAAGQALVPTIRLAALRRDFRLDRMVPASFGAWHEDRTTPVGIVNPETQAMLDRIYSQTLTRTYVDANGYRIMLSIAYGADQTDNSTQMHYPEVCYPAQGFRVLGTREDAIQVPGGSIRVRRLETQYGTTRHEPVTYWMIIGDRQSLGGWDKKKSELLHGLRGEIVDGLLFRVSSVDPDTGNAYRRQDAFVTSLVGAMSPAARRQLAGLG